MAPNTTIERPRRRQRLRDQYSGCSLKQSAGQPALIAASAGQGDQSAA
jgi:hypothetical protein